MGDFEPLIGPPAQELGSIPPVRRVWEFDNIEAALHHFCTFRDDLPVAVPDNPG